MPWPAVSDREAKAPTKIPIARPCYGPEELAAVAAPIESGWIVQGPRVKEFEDRFAGFTGAPHAIATTSCTTALHLAVAALGLEPGDEVIVPAFTWIPTANVAEYMGAKPVFVDIELSTFNVDTAQIDAALTDRTVGLIPVHLFGLCADMAAIAEIAGSRDLWVVEDAACSFGAWQNGRHAGTFGNAGCFSFHARKPITTGEGGMLTTADNQLETTARSLRDHGASRSDLDREQNKGSFLPADYERLGYNYRMTDIQGAIGVAQLDRADWILSERRRLANRYDTLLGDLDWLDTPHVPAGDIHGYQAYVCLFRPEAPTLENVDALSERRNALMLRLEQIGIATRQGTHAPALTGYYSKKYGLQREQFPNAALAESLSITLPLYPQMTDEQQDRVVTELLSAYDT
jgi:dTDP-4-amino-4,6-dideoxygalactose transaminase